MSTIAKTYEEKFLEEATNPERPRLRSGRLTMPENEVDGGTTTGADGQTMDRILQAVQGLSTRVENMQGELTALQGQVANRNPGLPPPTGQPSPTVQPQTGAPAPIRKLDIKLTEFDKEKPDLWFEDTERALAAANITDSTEKVVIINRYIPAHVREAKRNVFRTNDYAQVKAAIVKAVARSGEEKHRAFQNVQMGDRKAAEYIAELQSLVPEDPQQFQDYIMKHRFLSGLPADLAQLLQGDTFTLADGWHAESVEKYVQKVDELINLGKKRNATVGSVENADEDEAAVNAIMKRMGKEKFYQKFGGGPTKGTSSQQRKRSGSGTRAGNWTDRLCHIHKTHGDKAYNCAKTDTCPMAKTLAPKPEHSKKK